MNELNMLATPTVPTTSETWDFVNEMIKFAAKSLTRLGGDNYVLKSPSSQEAGVVVLRGEILLTSCFTPSPNLMVKVKEIQQEVADQGISYNIYKLRSLVVGNGTDSIRWDTFKPLCDLQCLLDTLNTHKNLVLNADKDIFPHGITKTTLGLGRVDNTADAEKIISRKTQIALNEKSNLEHDHKTLYESKNENIQTHICCVANAVNFPHGITKTTLGLGSVDNTADAKKPISDFQKIALDQKVNLEIEYINMSDLGEIPNRIANNVTKGGIKIKARIQGKIMYLFGEIEYQAGQSLNIVNRKEFTLKDIWKQKITMGQVVPINARYTNADGKGTGIACLDPTTGDITISLHPGSKTDTIYDMLFTLILN